MDFFGHKDEEKKVEYIELIYDLIFVYIIGRNNSILHFIDGGFIPMSAFLSYILGTLVILQIWYYTTLFINRYGENDAREYALIFINMFLLYYMAEGTRVSWYSYYVEYCAAWGLIMLNILIQYRLQLSKAEKSAPWEADMLKKYIKVILLQVIIIFVSIPLNLRFGLYLGPLAMVVGFVAAVFSRNIDRLVPIDFAHLSERVMLYIVFSFGEMIIAISDYFGGPVDFNSIYFALMCFLITAGLFASYGYAYDHIIDREGGSGNGNNYMLLHIFLIAALSCITTALEFMREPEVSEVPKVTFLVASFLVYFLFIALVFGRYAKESIKEKSSGFFRKLIILSAAFTVGMALCYKQNAVSIAITVLYVYAVFALLYRYANRE